MDNQYIQDFIKAGSIAKQVRAFGLSIIKKNASYNDVINQINQKIIELGGRPAFPPQIALNHVAAHFLPQPDEDIIFNDQVIKLDVGVCYNGAIGDCAASIDLSGKYQGLIEATEAALLAAERSIQVGMPLGELGKLIEETIASHGYTSIKNLSGHGLGYYKIHTSPEIPNYNNHSKEVVKPGMTFAIEPFATNGNELIHEEGKAAIFSFNKMRPTSSPICRYLLEKISHFKGLPFSMHQFVGDKFPLAEIKKGLYELMKTGIIDGYAPLVVGKQHMTAQAENSVLVDNDGNVLITTR
jgi:methionyl aminopeptidase